MLARCFRFHFSPFLTTSTSIQVQFHEFSFIHIETFIYRSLYLISSGIGHLLSAENAYIEESSTGDRDKDVLHVQKGEGEWISVGLFSSTTEVKELKPTVAEAKNILSPSEK